MAKKSFSLEKALQRMEEILRVLESGEKDLDESIRLFEEGMQLANECQVHLQALEQRVKVISEQENSAFATEVAKE